MLELKTGGFWPVVFQADHEPDVLIQYQDEMLMVGADGYVRSFTGSDDDGSDIASHLLVGPVQGAAILDTGLLSQIAAHLGEDGGAVTWRIVVGDSAEEAVETAKTAISRHQSSLSVSGYIKGSGTFTAGWNRVVRPRISAPWFVVWLESTDQWAYERITLQILPAGRKR